MQLAPLVLLLAASRALAHPGPHSSSALAHLLSEPDHLAALLAPAAIGLAWLLRKYLKRRR